MSAPLVSVIIPTYNRARILCEAVDSVLAQTHSSVEVIVVDDGSTDHTPASISKRYANDARVVYVRKENGGVTTARNRGLQQARGEFIALLDSDDVWLPWKLEAQLACLERFPAAGMIWTDMKAIDVGGRLTHERYLRVYYRAYRLHTMEALFDRSVSFSEVAPHLGEVAQAGRLYQGDIFSPMMRGSLVHTSTVLLRRERVERVGGFDESLGRSGEDYDFHLRTCREGPVAFLDVPSILYRHGASDQLTNHHKLMATNFLRTVERRIAADRDRIQLPQRVLDEVLAGAHEWIGSLLLAEGDRRGARQSALKSLRLQPTRISSAALLLQSLLPERVEEGFRRLKRTVTGRRPADA